MGKITPSWDRKVAARAARDPVAEIVAAELREVPGISPGLRVILVLVLVVLALALALYSPKVLAMVLVAMLVAMVLVAMVLVAMVLLRRNGLEDSKAPTPRTTSRSRGGSR